MLYGIFGRVRLEGAHPGLLSSLRCSVDYLISNIASVCTPMLKGAVFSNREWAMLKVALLESAISGGDCTSSMYTAFAAIPFSTRFDMLQSQAQSQHNGASVQEVHPAKTLGHSTVSVKGSYESREACPASGECAQQKEARAD